jgi:hypothetical protein
MPDTEELDFDGHREREGAEVHGPVRAEGRDELPAQGLHHLAVVLGDLRREEAGCRFTLSAVRRSFEIEHRWPHLASGPLDPLGAEPRLAHRLGVA